MHDIEALIFDGFFDIGKRHSTFVEYDGERFCRKIDNSFRHAVKLAHSTFDSLLTMTAVHTFYDDDLFQGTSLLPVLYCCNGILYTEGISLFIAHHCFGYFAVMAFHISGCSCPSRQSAMPAGLYLAMTSSFAFILRSSSNQTS